jgi:hypothetical protein
MIRVSPFFPTFSSFNVIFETGVVGALYFLKFVALTFAALFEKKLCGLALRLFQKDAVMRCFTNVFKKANFSELHPHKKYRHLAVLAYPVNFDRMRIWFRIRPLKKPDPDPESGSVLRQRNTLHVGKKVKVPLH